MMADAAPITPKNGPYIGFPSGNCDIVAVVFFTTPRLINQEKKKLTMGIPCQSKCKINLSEEN